MSTRHLPPSDYLRQVFRYDNGILYWNPRPRSHFSCDQAFKMWNTRYAGTVAGNLRKNKGGDRWIIRINGDNYRRYRIVWVMHNGDDIPDLIDHRNRNSTDDHIDNLRAATSSQNNGNSTMKVSRNTSGLKGVSFHTRSGKWVAQIVVDGKHHYLGAFADPDVAHSAYCAAAKEHFGEFACTG